MRYFPLSLTSEKSCTRAVVRHVNINFIPLHLRTEKVYRKMLKTNGLTLRDMDLEARMFLPPISLEIAVSNNGLALEFVPEELKTESLCSRAVHQNPQALRYVPMKLKTPELCMKAFEADPTTVAYIPRTQLSGKFFQKMIENDAMMIPYVPRKVLRSSRGFKIVTDAVMQNGLALYDVPQDLKEGPGGYEICLLAVGRHGLALVDVPMKHRTIELCQLALRENPEAIEYVPSVVIEAMKVFNF